MFYLLRYIGDTAPIEGGHFYESYRNAKRNADDTNEINRKVRIRLADEPERLASHYRDVEVVPFNLVPA